MADISRLGGGRAPQIRTGLSSVGNTGRTGNAPRTAAPEAPVPELPADVVSVSEDGDTVQVSPEGETRLEEDEEGRVIALSAEERRDGTETAAALPEEEQISPQGLQEESRAELQGRKEEREIVLPDYFKEEEDNAAIRDDRASREAEGARELIRMEKQEEEEEQEEADEAEATSFVGYTDYELEQMYLKGEISRQDYDQEMASREEEEEKLRDQAGAFAREMGADSFALEENEQLQQGMNAAFSPEANQTLSAADRMSMLGVAGGAPEALANRENEQMNISFN